MLPFNQRVVRLFLGHRHVNHQARRLLTIHELLLVDLPAELDESLLVAEDRGIRQFQRLRHLGEGSIRVLPNHQAVVVDLLGDQIANIF